MIKKLLPNFSYQKYTRDTIGAQELLWNSSTSTKLYTHNYLAQTRIWAASKLEKETNVVSYTQIQTKSPNTLTKKNDKGRDPNTLTEKNDKGREWKKVEKKRYVGERKRHINEMR